MSFVSGGFLLFLPLMVLGYWLCPARWRYLALLAGSLLFYMGWSVPLTLLLLGVTLLNWVSCLIVEKHKSKWLLGGLLTLIFLPLVVCKYAGFFAGSLHSVLGWPGQAVRDVLEQIILPVGISFYTFQAASCVLDVYRGEMQAERNPMRFTLFVSFFPQLVAGPIERGKDLLPQLNAPRRFDWADMRAGFRLLLTGFFRKICVADFLAVYADRVYGLAAPDGSAVALGTLCFAFQIYNDFAGYSEIAMGSARMLGIRLTRNFNEPYLARGIRDFWRRWHITLNSWFRSYVYWPLGGSRKGRGRMLLASTVVFLLSGLWHGASWTFVAWGALHALYYGMETLLLGRREAPSGWRAVVSVVITFTLVGLSWVLFRAVDMGHAAALYGALFSPWQVTQGLGQTGVDAAALQRIAVMLPLTFALGRWGHGMRPKRQCSRDRDIAISAILVLIIALCWLNGLGSDTQNVFIYFQF